MRVVQNNFITGGWHRVDPRDETVAEVISFCIDEISDEGGRKELEVVDILSAYAQVVNGLKYSFKVKVMEGRDTHHVYRIMILALRHPGSTGEIELLEYHTMEDDEP
jgi:hypothetical protein